MLVVEASAAGLSLLLSLLRLRVLFLGAGLASSAEGESIGRDSWFGSDMDWVTLESGKGDERPGR